MADIRQTMRQMMEAGVHFGHKTHRWNPKMRPFIFGAKDGIHILDLQQTVARLDEASKFVAGITASGDSILFVGTKKQAQSTVQEQAERAGQFYVNTRWLGGMLTNFPTIQTRIKYMNQLESRKENGEFDLLTKKEAQKLEEELRRLQRVFGGIRTMRRLPGAVFVIDTKKEHTAVAEARRLDIPVIALADTNCDPDEIDYPIPANDDAIRSVRLLCEHIADAALSGRTQLESRRKEPEDEGNEEMSVSATPVTLDEMAAPRTAEGGNTSTEAAVADTQEAQA